MTEFRRRIAVVTTSRADYSHLYWPLRLLSEDPRVELKLIVIGAHLSQEFGTTIREIEKDGFNIAARIECLLSSDSEWRICTSPRPLPRETKLSRWAKKRGG